MPTIYLERVSGDYGFVTTDEYGNEVKQDSSPEIGGNNFGARPMQLLLSALAGCSGIDVVLILKKQRQILTGFKIVVQGEREKGKEPSLWKEIKIHFKFYGEVEEEKALKAVELSINKYCSVAETLRLAGATIETTVSVNEL